MPGGAGLRLSRVEAASAQADDRPVSDMKSTPRFSKEHMHFWQMKDAAQHGRPF